MNNAVLAFLEYGIKDSDIMKILNGYFSIDSMTEISYYLNYAKNRRQIRSLRKLCIGKGMSSIQFKTYVDEHHLVERMKNDPSLLDLSPEKLKALLDKG